jgi:hypothetical protein
MSVSLEVDYQVDNLCTRRENIAQAAKSVKNWGFFCIILLIRESEKLYFPQSKLFAGLRGPVWYLRPILPSGECWAKASGKIFLQGCPPTEKTVDRNVTPHDFCDMSDNRSLSTHAEMVN